MGTRSSDFNYKVALASGLKSLQAGRLRQAEEQFRYLLSRFPDADGGYRGLAKVLIEQEDRPAALRMLLDGGAAVAKAGQRTAAIGLYRDATALDPSDLTAHRRLAAALTLSGDLSAAADEYVRYVEGALLLGSRERAHHEAAFALERMPSSPAVVKIARTLGLDVGDVAHVPAATSVTVPGASASSIGAVKAARHIDENERAALMRSAFGGAEAKPEPPPPTQPDGRETSASADQDLAPGPRVSGTESVARDGAAPNPWASGSRGDGESVSDPQAVTLGGDDGPQPVQDADSQAVEAAAARYLAKHDPRGGDAALEAARRYIADGRNDAASDLLLQLIASGVADHDAQRLLVEVVRTLGKSDVAKAKCHLLVQALRLDGREDLAAEVEQLALAD